MSCAGCHAIECWDAPNGCGCVCHTTGRAPKTPLELERDQLAAEVARLKEECAATALDLQGSAMELQSLHRALEQAADRDAKLVRLEEGVAIQWLNPIRRHVATEYTEAPTAAEAVRKAFPDEGGG